jgi:hypothetical protein
VAAEGTKGAGKPLCWEGRAPEIPALKPYRGKPAVRNFRGGSGNVGIIRSPVRAIALPDNLCVRVTVSQTLPWEPWVTISMATSGQFGELRPGAYQFPATPAGGRPHMVTLNRYDGLH